MMHAQCDGIVRCSSTCQAWRRLHAPSVANKRCARLGLQMHCCFGPSARRRHPALRRPVYYKDCTAPAGKFSSQKVVGAWSALITHAHAQIRFSCMRIRRLHAARAACDACVSHDKLTAFALPCMLSGVCRSTAHATANRCSTCVSSLAEKEVMFTLMPTGRR